jgi:hypothetical protein
MLILIPFTLGLAIAAAAEPVRVKLSGVHDTGLVKRDGSRQT